MENSEIKKQNKKTKTFKTHHSAEANHRAQPITADDVRIYRQRYFGLLVSERDEDREFEYVERAQAGLPEGRLGAATEVAVATPTLIRGLDKTTGAGDLWRPNLWGDGFGRALPEENRILGIRQFGQFWYPERMSGVDCSFQVLVFRFDNVPICTRTAEEAMRLAEHCSPIPRPPVPVCWIGPSSS